eukprot:574078-Pleurochrysis_carterae.AAC.1
MEAAKVVETRRGGHRRERGVRAAARLALGEHSRLLLRGFAAAQQAAQNVDPRRRRQQGLENRRVTGEISAKSWGAYRRRSVNESVARRWQAQFAFAVVNASQPAGEATYDVAVRVGARVPRSVVLRHH